MTDPVGFSKNQRLEKGLGPALILICALVFLPWLGGELVWDDPLLITENTLTHSLGNIGLFFQVDLWATSPKDVGSTGFYRPLMLLDLALDRAIFENSAMAMRVHSLLWHLLVLGLFLRLGSRLKLKPLAVVGGAILVALHPVQAEVIFFISARNDSMAAAWLLGALLWLLPEDGRLGWDRLIPGALCTLAAALCKESVLLAPLALVLLAQWKDRDWNLRGVAAMAAGLFAYVGLRLGAGITWPRRAGLLEALEGTPEVLSFFTADLLWPIDIGPGLHLTWPPDVPWVWLISGVGTLAALGYRCGRPGRLLLGLLAVLMIPAVFAATTTQMPAQRYLYLPMLAAGLGLGLVLEELKPTLQYGVNSLLVVVCSGLIGVNAGQWQSDLLLWEHAAERHGGGYAFGALAKTLDDLGRLEEAGEWYVRATSEVNPPFVESCWNVASVQMRMEEPRPWAALENGLAALENGCPPEEELLSPVGLALALGGNWEAAEGLLEETDRDPWGQIIVIQLAAAVVRQDLDPLLAEAGTLEPAHPLVRRVRNLLRMGGAEDTIEWMNQEASKRALRGLAP
jgi:tetratricopeptide (TPR) repeat protein